MTKQVRRIVVAVCVVGALLAATLLLYLLPGGSSSSSDTSSEAKISLLSLKSSDIQNMSVTNSSGTYNITHTGTDTYSIDPLKEAPINLSDLKTRLSAVAGLSATLEVAKDVTDLSPYGLDNPTATIDITTEAGKSYTIKIGNETPTSSGYYVLKPGTNDVYVSTSFSDYAFTGTAIDYASTTVTAVSTSANITKYTFGGTARPKPIVLDVTASTSSAGSTASSSTTYSYAVSEPLSYEANDTNAETITSSLQALSATEVADVDVSSANLAKYGLQNPAYTLTYTVGGKDTTLSFGNVTSDETVYVMVSGKAAVYLVNTTAVKFYNYQLSDLLSTLIYHHDISDLNTMTIEADGKSHSYTFSGDSDDLVVKEGDKKLNTSNFKNFYQNVISVSSAGTSDAPAAGTSSALTFTYTYRTGSDKDTVTFLPMGNDTYFAEINGEGACYVNASQISSLMQLADDVSAGKTVSAPSS